MNQAIQNRYEFVYLFDVEMGNPNGDPDAGNMPRIDYETNIGLVSDVCLKRKVRNYIDLLRADSGDQGLEIYIREKAVLNDQHELAYKAASLKPTSKKLPKKEEDEKKITGWMCENFFDVRTFGAVMTTDINCGQVRGPVQMAFAKSVEPIASQEVSITRMAVTHQRDLEKERTMGRKHVIPYALYRAEGFISAHLAEKTGFSEADLQRFWKALENMFEHDRSAARGKMAARRLIVFKHDSRLGEAPAHKLFEGVRVERLAATGDENGERRPARSFADYRVVLDPPPAGVERLELF